MSENNPQNPEAVRIEDDLERLESLVRELENGKDGLERSLALFEEGVKLAGQCQRRLESFDQRILEVVRGADGEASLVPFAHDPTHPS